MIITYFYCFMVLKLSEEVPPPSNDDVAERLVKRLVILCQRGEWDIAGESLKVIFLRKLNRLPQLIITVSGDDGGAK